MNPEDLRRYLYSPVTTSGDTTSWADFVSVYGQGNVIEEDTALDETVSSLERRGINSVEIKSRMKERHLSRGEREMLHNPETDWVETKRGDKCRNSCTFEVKDILIKHNVPEVG